ncbi:hypothetical protein B0H19DRAFT_1062370 [Mycena capillaripes]|nr:hypothetical protein B0H19DRAFT_1062370 [Mycena capillaripes]
MWTSLLTHEPTDSVRERSLAFRHNYVDPPNVSFAILATREFREWPASPFRGFHSMYDQCEVAAPSVAQSALNNGAFALVFMRRSTLLGDSDGDYENDSAILRIVFFAESWDNCANFDRTNSYFDSGSDSEAILGVAMKICLGLPEQRIMFSAELRKLSFRKPSQFNGSRGELHLKTEKALQICDERESQSQSQSESL